MPTVRPMYSVEYMLYCTSGTSIDATKARCILHWLAYSWQADVRDQCALSHWTSLWVASATINAQIIKRRGKDHGYGILRSVARGNPLWFGLDDTTAVCAHALALRKGSFFETTYLPRDVSNYLFRCQGATFNPAIEQMWKTGLQMSTDIQWVPTGPCLFSPLPVSWIASSDDGAFEIQIGTYSINTIVCLTLRIKQESGKVTTHD